MKIAIATGGSLGHVMPALLVGRYLKKAGHTVILVGPLEKWAHSINYHAVDFYNVEAKPIRLSLSSLKALFAAIKDLKKYFLKENIELVIGFGSYASVPGVLAGKRVGAKIVLHEQNVIPGQANKFLQFWADTIAVSFLPTQKYFSHKHVVMTGCPNLFSEPVGKSSDIYKELGFEESIGVILVFGGSQGSSDLNELFQYAAVELKTMIPFQVIHICGAQKQQELNAFYNDRKIKAKVFTFVENMSHFYAIADLVVGRAGALTVTELAHLQKRSILVPYPHAKAHQKYNAAILEQTGLAEIYEGHDPKILADKIVQNMSTPIDQSSLDRKLKDAFRSNATELLAKEVLCGR